MAIAKSRHEYKFSVNEKDLLMLGMRLEPLIARDAHVGEQGYYHIRSIYFDDYHNSSFYSNEAGVDPRVKYRIRIYNAGDASIKLEKKIKENGMTRKYAAPLSRQQADMLIRGQLLPIDQKDLESYPPLLAQFLLLMRTRRMQPKVIVAYDRIPYVDRRGNVRITFDRNIAASVDFPHFFEKEMQKIPLLPPGEHLLEVKYDEYLPAVLKQQLDLGKLRQETFSKYYLCRKRAGNEHFFEHL